jgi:hypothetical protein
VTNEYPAPRAVAAPLEADLRADGHYTTFVDRLAATRKAQPEQVPFSLLAYRGSHLALMLEAEDSAAGGEQTALVVRVPRFTEERVNDSPALTAPAVFSVRHVRPVAKRSLCARS